MQRWETSPRAPHQPAPEIILTDPTVERLALELPACRRLPADAVDLVVDKGVLGPQAQVDAIELQLEDLPDEGLLLGQTPQDRAGGQVIELPPGAQLEGGFQDQVQRG